MVTNPEVSVVIPMFDHESYIGRAIDSVLSQSLEAWRLIVVDDGSRDEGAARVQAYSDRRIKLIRTANHGPGHARNIGIAAAETPLIGLLDADDKWAPSFLERTLDVAMQEPRANAIFTHIRVSGRTANVPSIGTGFVTDYLRDQFDHRIAMTSSSIVVRRDILVGAGRFPEPHCWAEDTDTWFRLAMIGGIYFVNEPLCTRHVATKGGLTLTTTHRQRAEGLAALLDTYQRYLSTGQIPGHLLSSCEAFMNIQRAQLALHLVSCGERIAGIRKLSRVRLRRRTWQTFLRCLVRIFRSRP